MAANTTPSGGDISALRARGVAILSRLLWYDKKQFKSYLQMFVETKSVPFILNFLHGYLSFCCDATSPFSNVNVVQGVVAFGANSQNNSNANSQPFPQSNKMTFDFTNQHNQGRPRVSVITSQELNHSYETNFSNGNHLSKQSMENTSSSNQTQSHGGSNAMDGTSSHNSSAAPGTPRAVENIIVSTTYRRVVSKLVDKLSWLKLPDNDQQYLDVRGLMHYVKQWHGGTFRRVVLSGLLDSTRNLVKTQYRVELGYTSTSGHVSTEGMRG